MATGTYNTSQRVTAAASTAWQTMVNVYTPAYGAAQSLSSPSITIGVRDNARLNNAIYWKADVYDYDPPAPRGTGCCSGPPRVTTRRTPPAPARSP